MDRDRLRSILEQVRGRKLDVDEAMEALSRLPFERVDGLCLDLHRPLRTGFPEAVYGPGKTLDELEEALRSLEAAGCTPAMATRLDPEVGEALSNRLPGAVFHPRARALTLGKPRPVEDPERFAALVTAGAADRPVAEEAALTLRLCGIRVEGLWDVGAAGLPRLLSGLELLRRAAVLLVFAGMDGVLPGLIAGLVEAPVIGVPVSAGYGTGEGGRAALLTMLNSCSPGLVVVNIDCGYGAGIAAARFLKGPRRLSP